MFYIKRFFKNLYRDFINIYYEEEDLRKNFGEEYVQRFRDIDPVTGKRKVSVYKILVRIVIVIIFSLYMYFMIRLIMGGAWTSPSDHRKL